MSLKTLLNEANTCDLTVFPQKANPGKFTIAANDEKGNRFFITRVAAGLNEDGSAKYIWARGSAMKARTEVTD
jgi:hypothetical protein